MSDRIAVFNGGRIEQVAAPIEIYRRPQTPFVAGFVGDNNVLNGVATDPIVGRFHIDGMGYVGGMPATVAVNSPVWIAVRPESIRLAAPDRGDGSPFKFKVSGIVNFGDSALLHGTIGNVPMKVRLSTFDVTTVREGDILLVQWSAESAHVIAA